MEEIVNRVLVYRADGANNGPPKGQLRATFVLGNEAKDVAFEDALSADELTSAEDMFVKLIAFAASE